MRRELSHVSMRRDTVWNQEIMWHSQKYRVWLKLITPLPEKSRCVYHAAIIIAMASLCYVFLCLSRIWWFDNVFWFNFKKKLWKLLQFRNRFIYWIIKSSRICLVKVIIFKAFFFKLHERKTMTKYNIGLPLHGICYDSLIILVECCTLLSHGTTKFLQL